MCSILAILLWQMKQLQRDVRFFFERLESEMRDVLYRIVSNLGVSTSSHEVLMKSPFHLFQLSAQSIKPHILVAAPREGGSKFKKFEMNHLDLDHDDDDDDEG
jgi:hypothetical protein